MKNKTILVRGATGKQGGAVARHLFKAGFSVKALTRNRQSMKGMFSKNGGKCDPNLLGRSLNY